MLSNHIGPTISHQSDIIQDMDLYRLGGVSYRENTTQSEYEATQQPQDTTKLIAPFGGYP